MPVEMDGRRSLGRESGAPSRSTVNARRPNQDQSASACDSTTRTYRPSSVHPRTYDAPRHTAPSFPVRTSNAAAWALFTLVVGVILIAVCVVVTLGWPS